jgi:hypothetical protein
LSASIAARQAVKASARCGRGGGDDDGDVADLEAAEAVVDRHARAGDLGLDGRRRCCA